MEYQIFISYRRDGAEVLSRLLHFQLTNDNYSVFLDVENLRSGKFNEQLLQRIDECTDVLVLLPSGGLDRCWNQDDWVRKEITYAIRQKKNIIPVMMRNFQWPDKLPEDMAGLPNYQGVRADMEMFDGWYAKLRSLLSCSDQAAPKAQDIHLYEQIYQEFTRLFDGKSKKKEGSWIRKKIESQTADTKAADMPELKTTRISMAACREELNDTSLNSVETEQNFIVIDMPGAKTIAFEILDRINWESQSIYRYCSKLNYESHLLDSGKTETAFYVNADGNDKYFILLTFLPEADITCNTALLTADDKFYISRKPSHFGQVRFSSDGNLIKNNASQSLLNDFLAMGVATETESSCDESETILVSECDFDPRYLTYLIIDTKTRENVIPEIKQTPGGDVKLRLKLYAHRKYAVLECVPEDMDFLYDCGIGYLCGLYGLKKDIFKAADAFHENIELYQNRMESCFELGAMFRHLEEIRSREDALHYLTMAANAKHSGARFELAELLLESSDSADITKGKALLAELLQEGYESYGDQIEIADILENI